MSAHRFEQALEQQILTVTGAQRIVSVEPIQSLWSGYGDITRVRLNIPNQREPISVVVKRVNPPKISQHPRGWDSSASNKRKLKSYGVEAYWYEKYAGRCKERCTVPALIVSEQASDTRWLVLEDLNPIFPNRHSVLSVRQCLPCLQWLARFHALFLGSDGIGLWPIGTYWHLATRAEEFVAMAEGDLKQSAHRLDATLNQCNYQTLVHGDAKVANFCFSESGRDVSMVDFQYVGCGCGVKDVAYFMGSCLDSDTCLKFEDSLLDVYFSELRRHLPNQQGRRVEAEWRHHYDFAVADFHRFLAGWMPTHSKVNPYMAQKTQRALHKLASHQR